jgi:hypothetical protein
LWTTKSSSKEVAAAVNWSEFRALCHRQTNGVGRRNGPERVGKDFYAFLIRVLIEKKSIKKKLSFIFLTKIIFCMQISNIKKL